MKTDELIKVFGTASRLSRFLGISPQAIYQWPEYVPRHWGYEVEARSKGVIKYTPEPGSKTEAIVQVNFCSFVSTNKSTKK